MILEGGNFFKEADKLDRSEIPRLIVEFARKTETDPIILAKGLAGGTLKHPTVNDIDLVLPEEMKEKILKNLKKHGFEYSEKRNVIHVLFPYKDKKIQMDLGFSKEPEFLKFYLKSPKEKNLKGVHKNILLALIAKYTDREESPEKDQYDRPVWEKRWKWSVKDGLVYIREETIEKNGKTLKKRNIVVLKPPIKNPEKIAKILLGPDAKEEDMEYISTILKKLKENKPHIYGKVTDEWKKALEKSKLEVPTDDIFETSTAGSTSAGNIATFAFPVGKRKNIIRRTGLFI